MVNKKTIVLDGCPMCGDINISIESCMLDADYYVRCSTCGVRGSYEDTFDSAVTAWNRRVDNGK